MFRTKFPRQVRINIAVTIQASLLYAAATWPELSPAQGKKLAIICYSPLRRAVDGAWTKTNPQRPLGCDEVVVLAAWPSFDDAFSASRLRFLPRLKHAPPTFLALLQTAGAQWRTLIFADLEALQSAVSPYIESLASTPNTVGRVA